MTQALCDKRATIAGLATALDARGADKISMSIGNDAALAPRCWRYGHTFGRPLAGVAQTRQ
jgi:hypothetical protein